MGNKNDIKVLAFYLPQYHPIKENNVWFGEGFTEWTNVGKAQPLFKGHYQPRVPADLGYYDLRIPEVRKKQAELAKEAGISAFCYYHYWFGNGRQIMEMPLNEVVRTGEPDFPFCICWANHSFFRKSWNPQTNILNKELLLEQTYPNDEDIIEHFKSLLPAFRDNRYFKIDGKLVFMIYNISAIPDFQRFKSIWKDLSNEYGLPGFFYIGYTTKKEEINNLLDQCDAVNLELLHNTNINSYGFISNIRRRIFSVIGYFLKRPMFVKDYAEYIHNLVDPIEKSDRIIPQIIPNWDWSPRRGAAGLILHNSTPKNFQHHVEDVIKLLKNKPSNRKLIFLKSWNEWGEGNYLEPDLKFGKGYIKALKSALDKSANSNQ